MLIAVAVVSCKKEQFENTITYKLECERCTLILSSELDKKPYYVVNNRFEKTFFLPKKFQSYINISNTVETFNFKLTTYINGNKMKETKGFVSDTTFFEELEMLY